MSAATSTPAPCLSSATSPGSLRNDALARANAPPEHAPLGILGGGPIGLVSALLLARNGFSCELVDARPIEALRRDRRLLALSRGTLQVLESLVGPGFAPMGTIERVRVSSRGELGAVQLGAQDFGGIALGATVWYADLADALERAAREQASIRVQRPRRVLRILQKIDRVELTLDEGSVLECALAIDAEGSPTQVREPQHYALLAELELSGLRHGDAVERFTREGPLALLPLPGTTSAGTTQSRYATVPAQRSGRLRADGRQSERTGSMRMSMIWCLPAALAQARMGLADSELRVQIAQALGPRIGAPTAIAARSVFPLAMHRLDRVSEHRLVHLGNAAQSLHPVAGQGFNLGIRDCVCLVDALIETRARQDVDPLRALAGYGARRRMDRTLFPAFTSALPRLFSSSFAPLVAARSAALLTLDLMPGLRREFTRLLMFGAPR